MENNTQQMSQSYPCVQCAFESQVLATPSATAVYQQGVETSYQSLHWLSNHVAAHLRTVGVGPGDIVAINMKHSLELVVAMLAVLKCGAAYLPIDDGNPTARNVGYMERTNTQVMISRPVDLSDYPEHLTVVFSDVEGLFTTQLEDFEAHAGSGDDLAYVMFTSGSTGQPKGVMVAHRGIVRLVKDSNYVSIKQDDRILQLAPPSFDASTFEFWGALLNGAVLVPYSNAVLDPNKLRDDIEQNHITVLWLTAALFHLVVDRFIDTLTGLRVMLAGGDVLSAKHINKLLDAAPHVTVINGYGPTENTTFTCCHPMSVDNRPDNFVLIGKAVSGTTTFVLDEQGDMVAKGEQGELVVGGAGVALGYLNDEGNRAFYRDERLSDGLLYRTGDIVKQNPDETFEFVGRKDNQVKVRGFRVSLEEIKTHIVALEQVSDALVLRKSFDSGDQIIVAYVQLKQEGALSIKEIKALLAEVIPSYMIPNQFILRNDLPINDNGKLDKHAILQMI